MQSVHLSQHAADRNTNRDNTVPTHMACLLCPRVQDQPTLSNRCSHETLLSALFNVWRSGLPSTPKKKRKMQHVQSSWCKTDPVVCDGNFVGYASGLHFCRCVRGATAVHVLELYAVQNCCQGVPPTSHLFPLGPYVLQVVHSTVARRMLSSRCVSSCASNHHTGPCRC